MDNKVKKSWPGHRRYVELYFLEMLDLIDMIKYDREEELRFDMEKINRRNSNEL